MAGPPGTQILYTSRGKPQRNPDTNYREQRGDPYGSNFIYPLGMTKHGYADEGSYFIASDSAGRATAAAPTSFSDTAPLCMITNTDSASNPQAKLVYVDYLRAIETSAGTAGVSFLIKVELDSISRFSSGGTTITPNNVNANDGTKPVSQLIVLPTTTAVTANNRNITNSAVVLPTVTTPIAVNSEWVAYFGGDGAKFGFVSGSFGWAGSSYGPLIIGPQQAAIFPFIITSQSAASSWQLECGVWER